jgi:2TM domain-containing protein
MPKDRSALALLAHFAIYALTVAVCAGVNLWLSPDNLWFIWIALGWGIGVAAHALAFWLRHTRRRARVFIDCKARGAAVHLFAYVAVVALLLVVNLTMTPQAWWFYWVALGWGAGVAFHIWCAFFRKRESPRTLRNGSTKRSEQVEHP